MSLIGEIGLIGLMLQAGIEMDVAQLKETGIRSLIMAFTGAMIPLVMGIGLATAAGIEIRAAIALGSCFSPTSFGVASNALNAGNVLNTPVGQLIVAACVLDDLIALVLLSMLRVIIDPNAKIYQYFIPIISSVGFLLLLGWSGLTWLPKLIENRILPSFSEKTRPFIAFGLMMILLLTYLPILYYSRSSYLTGAFLAGLTFSQIPSIHITFVNEMSSLMSWLLRLFFAATIGFQIPITLFSNPYIIQWGFIFCKCSCILRPVQSVYSHI
jgi:Kef-type K+ transport system membrane component KefB